LTFKLNESYNLLTMRKIFILGCLITFFLILTGCQNIEKKEEKVKEESIKEKISDLITKEEPEKKIDFGISEIPKVTPGIKEKKNSEVEKKEYSEEIVSENLYPIPENIKFVSPSEINQEMAEIFQNIYFDYDSYDIKKEEIEILKKIGDYLIKNPEIMVLIEGHCDERGTREYNLVLGEQRALSVRNFLINLGVSSKRLFTVSYGEDKPAVLGSNESAWAKNRRCEFKIGIEK